MGTLLNALRRMQQVPLRDGMAPLDHTSIIVVNSQGKPQQNSPRVMEMDRSSEQSASSHSRAPARQCSNDHDRTIWARSGLKPGRLDEQVDETLARVDALLAEALAAGKEIAAQPVPAPAAEKPSRPLAGFVDQIREIAADGTVSCPAREALVHSANWQATLDTLDEELQFFDGQDALGLAEVSDSDHSIPCASGCRETIESDAQEQAGQLQSAVCVPTHQVTVLQNRHSREEGPRVRSLPACQDHQFRQALDYAARVMSDTKHLTVDLLGSSEANGSETNSPTKHSETSDPGHDEDISVHDWDEEPAAFHDDSHPAEWDDGDQGEVEVALRDDTPPSTEDSKPVQNPSSGPARSCTSFEHELAVKMANPRFLDQCHAMALRVRQDLANSLGGRVVVLLGCEDECDVSDVAAALGHVFGQSHSARVLLVDAHATVQALSHHYHFAGVPGLAEVCKSMDRWNALVQPTHHEKLFVMPSGCRLDPVPPSQDILEELMRKMRDLFDLVIVDAGKADSPWAGLCLSTGDAAYLVVQLGNTDRAQAIRMMASLKARQLTLKGCMVTSSGASSESLRGRDALN